MSLEQTLGADIVTAMKARDQNRLTALRMLKTALTNKSIEKGRALDNTEELQVVSMLVKQRRDSIEQFTKGGRQDLADKEQAEIVVLNTYLPAAASDDDIAGALQMVAIDLNVTGDQESRAALSPRAKQPDQGFRRSPLFVGQAFGHRRLRQSVGQRLTASEYQWF